jgi:aquaporin rerated protein, other eukaryote
MFMTAQLVLVVFMLAVEKHKSTFLAPIGIGLTLFIGQLVGVYYTGGSLNPARSFGPDVVLGSFPGYHWIYCTSQKKELIISGVGPGLGAIVSTGLYTMMKVLDYDKVNGTQDRDDTLLIAHIIQREPHDSQNSDRSNGTASTVVNPGQGVGNNKEDFVENILVKEMKNQSGPLSPDEGTNNDGLTSIV